MSISGALSMLVLTLTFFTRLPFPNSITQLIRSDDTLRSSAAFFPVAGLVVGFIAALGWLLASHLVPAPVAATLAVTLAIMVTGALHDDGLADCADGLGATSDRIRALEIMRDSRIGSYGTLALIASFALRVAALASLSSGAGFAALLIAHSGSRSAMTFAMRFSRYAREKGLGNMVEGELENPIFLLGLGIALGAAFILGGFAGLAAVGIGFTVAFAFLKFLDRRLGGYTGDGLGAMQLLCEITILISLAGFWS